MNTSTNIGSDNLSNTQVNGNSDRGKRAERNGKPKAADCAGATPKKLVHTVLHTNLLQLAESADGFAVSEVSGYSPEQVRRAAEALVAAGEIVRAKMSARRVRYFANDKLASAYSDSRVATSRSTQSAGGTRTKAPWKPEDPAIITPNTKIYIAPPPPSDVFRTNTYLKF